MDTTQQARLWYLPQDSRSAVDALENVKFIVRFLQDTITQEGFKPGTDIRYSDEGICGLYHIYGLIEDVLDNSIHKLLEVKQ